MSIPTVFTGITKDMYIIPSYREAVWSSQVFMWEMDEQIKSHDHMNCLTGTWVMISFGSNIISDFTKSQNPHDRRNLRKVDMSQ